MVVNIAEWLEEIKCRPHDLHISDAVQHLNMTKWLHSRGYKLNNKILERAVDRTFNFQVILYLLDNGCTWTDEVSLNALNHGHFNLLHWCESRGYLNKAIFTSRLQLYMGDCVDCPLKINTFRFFRWLTQDKGCKVEMEHKNILVNTRWIWGEQDVDLLEWLFQQGYCLRFEWCDYACPDFFFLKWAHGKNALLDNICSYAAIGGDINVLQWLWEQGYKIDEKVCFAAASHSSFAALKWLRAKDCPWDRRVCDVARKNGFLEMFDWARAVEDTDSIAGKGKHSSLF